MFTRALGLASMLLAGGAVAGCYSPGSLCQGTVDRTNQLYERCGYPLHVVLVLGGEPRECGSVSRVGNPDQIVYTCWPWLENVACEDLMEGEPGQPMLDPSCDYGQFESH